VITAFSADRAAPDRPVPVRVTVRNRGTASTTDPFDVHIWADPATPPTTSTTTRFIGHLSFNALAAGASATVSGSLLAGELTAGPHTLWALADAHGLIGESDEDNNTRSTSLTIAGAGDSAPRPLVNPGFEDRLTGWVRQSRFASVADIETTVVHSGARAFRFRGKRAGPQLHQDVAASPGTVTVSGWVNVTVRNARQKGQIELVALNASKRTLATYQVYAFPRVTGGWEPVSATRALPTGTAFVRLRVRFPTLDGTIYLDDFAIFGGSVGADEPELRANPPPGDEASPGG
jgi:hypothetical protein